MRLLPTTHVTDARYLGELGSTESTKSPEKEKLFWAESTMADSNRGGLYGEVIGDSGDIGVVVLAQGPGNLGRGSAQGRGWLR